MTLPIEELIAGLSADELREVVTAAINRHGDVERHVHLIAARATGDVAQLRADVDRDLRTRRFLGYRESAEWATAARPIIHELERAVDTSPSRALVELLQRAVGHVVKVIMHADDSNGMIGNLARELLALHARACDAGVADPVKLGTWMVRFRFDDQDFFEADPVRYANALGEKGLAAYRKAVSARPDDDSFAARYARERLAIVDRDVDALVALLGGDLTRPHQFVRLAEAMRELELDDDVLAWATRGIAQTSGWQTEKLYELACDVHTRREMPLEVLALRRTQHGRMPSSGTYRGLRIAADALDAWPVERDAARATLQRADPRGFVLALLDDGELEMAWDAAVAAPQLGADLWLRLAEACEPARPADALAVYQRIADEVLEQADRRAYRRAAKILQRARSAANAADQLDAFNDYLARLRERYRRRPSLIEILDKAKLT